MVTTEVRLSESVAGADKVGRRWRAKIIAADTWGSSAYYPAEVLERDGSRVFTEGLKMFQDHPKESDEYERPERSVRDMVGKLVSEAVYEADNPEGPGLYADVEFYDSFLSSINEKHQDVGLSVRAQGLTEDGEMDGRFGPILVGLLAAKSVDVVTQAGAGGKLTSILESDRDLAGRPIESTEGTSVTDVTKEDFDALATKLEASITGLSESIVAGITEALRPAEKTDEELAAELAAAQKTDEVVIDHAAVVEALRTENLPAASAGAVIVALKEGKTLEDAIKAQVELREAFVSTQPETGVVIKESAKPTKTGLAAAVELLG